MNCGVKISCGGICKNHEKNKRSPPPPPPPSPFILNLRVFHLILLHFMQTTCDIGACRRVSDAVWDMQSNGAHAGNLWPAGVRFANGFVGKKSYLCYTTGLASYALHHGTPLISSFY